MHHSPLLWTYGVFDTHWATRHQNRSIRHPTGKYQHLGKWKNILYTEFASSYDLHLHGEKNVPEQIFLIYKPCIVLHCYFVCGKIDASSIIIWQLKTASARAIISSGNVVVFQRATYASQCKLRRSFNISHKI